MQSCHGLLEPSLLTIVQACYCLLGLSLLTNEVKWRNMNIEVCLEEELDEKLDCVMFCSLEEGGPLWYGWYWLTVGMWLGKAMSMGSQGNGCWPLGLHCFGVGNMFTICLLLGGPSRWEKGEMGSDTLRESCYRMSMWLEDEGMESEGDLQV